MSDLVIQRAERSQVKLRIALQAVSGGGKTATSLLMARGMVAELGRRGKLPEHLNCHIGLIDTERDSASLYSHLCEFDTIPLAPPYTPERYLDALGMLVRAGYSVIIMDQITHEWHGEGGILQQVQSIVSKGGNEYTAWKKPSEAHDRFIDGILNCPTHIICTMRSKTAYALEKNEKGKMVPVRIGLQARQREGTEFEFTTVLDLASGSNAATCHKDRTELFKVGELVPRDASYRPSERSMGLGPDWGRRLIEWVYTATKPGAVAPEIAAEERCIAIADAGVRACGRAPNLPDLQLVYQAQVRAVREFQASAGSEVVKREEARLVAAKDARKAALGSVDAAPSVGEPISATDLINLETLLSDAGVLAADLKARFKVPRMTALPLAQWENVIGWVIEHAAERGITLQPIKHVPDPEDPEPATAVDVLHNTIEKIADSRGGLFSGMKDDLPWQD